MNKNKKKEQEDQLVEALKKTFPDLEKKIKVKDTEIIFCYYRSLKIEYALNRNEYNRVSHSLSKKARQAQYLTLIYKQGCLKALEYALGIEEEALDDSKKT